MPVTHARIPRGTPALVAALVLLLPAAGCRYIPTVAGGPAAVLPEGARANPDPESGRPDGGCLWFESWHADEIGESGTLFFPHPLWIEGKGLGGGRDVVYGMQTLRAFGAIRQQILGEPRDFRRRGCGPLDVSVEAGASVLLLMDVMQIDGHLGVNVSKSLGRATPYASFRYHLAALDAPVGLLDARLDVRAPGTVRPLPRLRRGFFPLWTLRSP